MRQLCRPEINSINWNWVPAVAGVCASVPYWPSLMTYCYSFCESIPFSAVNTKAESILPRMQTPPNLLDIHLYMVTFYEMFPLWNMKSHDMKGCGSCRFGCYRLYSPSGFTYFSSLSLVGSVDSARLCHMWGSKQKGDDGGGEEEGGGGSFLPSCCLLPSQTTGPGAPWMHVSSYLLGTLQVHLH